jgi:hypothetical protein
VVLRRDSRHVERKVSKNGTSSRDPFTGTFIKDYEFLVIRTAVKELKRVKVMKTIFEGDDRVLERDVVRAINVGLRFLSSNGRPVALASTGPMRRG